MKYGIFLFLLIFKMYAMSVSVIVCFLCFDIFLYFLKIVISCYYNYNFVSNKDIYMSV